MFSFFLFSIRLIQQRSSTRQLTFGSIWLRRVEGLAKVVCKFRCALVVSSFLSPSLQCYFSSIWLILCCLCMCTGSWMRGWRQIEQSTDRASKEYDMRCSLRDWDARYPEIHHELIVRWLCGAAVSLVTTSLYNGLVRSNRKRYY